MEDEADEDDAPVEDAEDAEDSAAISPALQIALWGITCGAMRDLAALVRGSCVICGTARRAEFDPNPIVRASAKRFTAFVRGMAQCSLPIVDCAAAAAAFWGKQRNTPYSAAQRAELVLAHIFYCNDSAWMLRVALMRCNIQANAAMAYVGRHSFSGRFCGNKKYRAVRTIADSASAAIKSYRCCNPGAIMSVRAPADVAPAPVRRWCVLCHGPAAGPAAPEGAAAAHRDMCARYLSLLISGRCGRAVELAETIATAATVDDMRVLGVTQAEIARAVVAHYTLHDASAAALEHRLNALANALSVATLGEAVVLEGGTLAPNMGPEFYVTKARGAVAQLHAVVARVPGTVCFGGMPLHGLWAVQSG